MIGFVEGTLLISNTLLILFSIVYGLLILKKKKKEESRVWTYFIIASALFFISELLTVATEILSFDVGITKAIVIVLFGITVLFAFLSKYNSLTKAKVP